MRVLKAIVVLLAVGFGVHLLDRTPRVQPNENGFIPVTMPDGARPNTVLVFTPLNCPSDAARRAAALAEELGRRGIPHVTTNSYDASDPDPARIKQTFSVMEGEIPAVLVNGMGMSNPTAEQVVAEFRRTRQ